MFQNRRRQPGMGVMLLMYQLFAVIGIDRIPPVTLSAIGLQVAIFLRLFKLPWYKPTDICVSAYRVWTKKEYSRLVFAALEHGDDWHLYYNMVSFALKGQSLERRFGSVKFLYILSVFTVLTNSVLVALNIFSNKYLNYEEQCAVGFSGVIFALKVLTTYYDRGFTQIMGMPLIVPTRYAVWFELVLIQLLVPNVSFYGHLAGILVGTAYVMGPLRLVMDLIYSIAKGILFPPSPRFTPRAEPSGYSSGSYNQYAESANSTGGRYNQYAESANSTGGRYNQYAESSDSTSGRYNQYIPPGMSEEEQIRQAMEESMRSGPSFRNWSPSSAYSPPNSSSPPPPGFIFGDNINSSAPPPPGFNPDIDELRSKREARFKH